MRFDECDRIATCKSALTCNSEVRSTGVPLSAASKAKPIAESVVTRKGVRAFGVSSFECVALCTIRSLTGVCQQCMGPPWLRGYVASGLATVAQLLGFFTTSRWFTSRLLLLLSLLKQKLRKRGERNHVFWTGFH